MAATITKPIGFIGAGQVILLVGPGASLHGALCAELIIRARKRANDESDPVAQYRWQRPWRVASQRRELPQQIPCFVLIHPRAARMFSEASVLLDVTAVLM